MLATRDEILDAALRLSETDRLAIVDRLMDTLPDDPPGLCVDDPGFVAELERRAQDLEGLVPASELFKKA